jgi:hypothetical protein
VLSRSRANIIYSPFSGGRHSLEPLGRGLRPSRTTKSIMQRLSVAPEQHTLTAPSGTCRSIEIEFAAGGRLGITGAIDANGSSRGTDQWTATMIPLPAGVRVWLATSYVDMWKGFPSLAYRRSVGVIMMPSHDIGVQRRELCSNRRSTCDCSRRAASRYLVGSSPRLSHSTARRTIACGVSCHSPRRTSCGAS